MLRLGVNIDHVATIRNARGGVHPCPVQSALLAEAAGADGITAHLREDRRHIKDADIANLMLNIKLPLNLEMAATAEMQQIALKTKPHAVCIVPEKRQEVTTEGGLDVAGNAEYLTSYIKPLKDAGIRVSLFIAPNLTQIDDAKAVGAQVVEFHTGKYCESLAQTDLQDLVNAVSYAAKLGLECHAGHGISFDTVTEIARIPEIVELNIGHFLIGEAIFIGLEQAIKQMKQLMQEARK